MDVFIAALWATIQAYWIFALVFFVVIAFVMPFASKRLAARYEWYNEHFTVRTYKDSWWRALLNVVVYILLMTVLRLIQGP